MVEKFPEAMQIGGVIDEQTSKVNRPLTEDRNIDLLAFMK